MSSQHEQAPWSLCPDEFVLHPGDVHLWRVRLDKAGYAERLKTVLSSDEVSRMSRYHHERDRDKFAICRGALRYLLARYVGVRAEHVEIAYGAHGKPFVVSSRSDIPLEFNISHSSNYALMGFAMGRQIGVDVERVRADLDIEGVSSAFMSPLERADILRRSGQDKVKAFFRYWTCKEAYLKVRGTGMTLDPRSFCMSLTGPELVQPPACDRRPEAWAFSWVDVAPDFCGALAFEACVPLHCEFYDFK